jgi:hypothetical protein
MATLKIWEESLIVILGREREVVVPFEATRAA